MHMLEQTMTHKMQKVKRYNLLKKKKKSKSKTTTTTKVLFNIRDENFIKKKEAQTKQHQQKIFRS